MLYILQYSKILNRFSFCMNFINIFIGIYIYIYIYIYVYIYIYIYDLHYYILFIKLSMYCIHLLKDGVFHGCDFRYILNILF